MSASAKIDIFIKSFNRPYYLARCLKSIEQNVTGFHEIIILDDGTDNRYLNKIIAEFPTVKIVKSPFYEEKCLAIKERGPLPKNSYPNSFWFQNIKNASEYVLVLEDDVWFTRSLRIDRVVQQMQERYTQLVHFGDRLKNTRYTTVQGQYFDWEYPKLKTKSLKLINLIYSNRFKLYSILKRLGLFTAKDLNDYYTLISISRGLHKRDFWLATWEGLGDKINEKGQIKNSLLEFKNSRNTEYFFGRLKIPAVKTTYQSSATSLGNHPAGNLNIYDLNRIFNEKWFLDEFDPMQNYPKDFSEDYIKKFLDQADLKEAQYHDWKRWTEGFKRQYRELGVIVE